MEATEPLAALGLVAAGLGLTTVQQSLDHQAPDGVVLRELPWFSYRTPLWAAWHRINLRPWSRPSAGRSCAPPPKASRHSATEPTALCRACLGVAHHHETLFCGRCNEVAGDLLEFLIAGLEGMLAACIACTQPRLADLVGDIEEVQLMRGAHWREHHVPTRGLRAC